MRKKEKFLSHNMPQLLIVHHQNILNNIQQKMDLLEIRGVVEI